LPYQARLFPVLERKATTLAGISTHGANQRRIVVMQLDKLIGAIFLGQFDLIV